MWGMIFVQGLALVPTTFLLLAPSFRNMDPNLEEAALASGARPLTVVRRIILPMVSPASFAAAAFLLIVGMVIFDIPGILA
jgi:iron(III) transport system permease protein